MGGTIRTYDEKTRAYLKERMTAIAKSIAEAFRASAEVSFGSGCPTLVNDKDLSEKVTGISKTCWAQTARSPRRNSTAANLPGAAVRRILPTSVMKSRP